MKRVWQMPAAITAGLLVTAMYAMPQAYTISARPGVVNYVEGDAYINGKHIAAKNTKQTILGTNEVLAVDHGKAEILLTPGVFLRVGDDSEVRMVAPSLTDTQVELAKGEAILEVAQLVKENNIQILDHGGVAKIEKTGLYRFSAGNPPTAAVIDGKLAVEFGDKKVSLGKGHETIVSEALKSEKFDKKREDDLYAWSNVRDEYNSAASYASAKTVQMNNYNSSFGSTWGPGFNGWAGGPGWFWNAGFNSWAWLPGDGAFFSPFGYGYFSPGYVTYAPLVYVPVSGGYAGVVRRPVAVPVNPKRPPVVGLATRSPAQNALMREQALHMQSRPATTNMPSQPRIVMPRTSAWAGGVPANGGHVSSRAMTASPRAPSASPGYSGAGMARGSAPAPASRPMSAPSSAPSMSRAPSGGATRR